MNIFLDSCFIIYLFEGNNNFQTKAITALNQFKQNNPIYHTSSISILECLVKPKKDKNLPLIQDYETFFKKINIHPVSDPVIQKALDLRVSMNLKTPDAIHLGTSISKKGNLFLTGDQQLKNCQGIQDLVI